MAQTEIDLTPGGIATLACLLEVSAPKPGNVHRGADFEDVTFNDFLVSAVVVGQVIDSLAEAPLGETVLETVEKTISNVGSNTNLGIVLLLVPLAKIVIANRPALLDQASAEEYFQSLSPSEGAEVFAAIAKANPGGLGKVDELDVNSSDHSNIDLMSAMKLAKARDLIARQYVTGFQVIFDSAVPLLMTGVRIFKDLSQAIVFAHVALMSKHADSLIARKCGQEKAEQSRILASKAFDLLDSDQQTESQLELYWSAVGELDFWLRSDGHRRNPGTTADIIAATLFVAIYNGHIKPPFNTPC